MISRARWGLGLLFSTTPRAARALGILCVLATLGAISAFGALERSAHAEIGDDSILVKDPNTALEWQKVNLEDRIQSKLNRAISPVIADKHFIVNVAIELKNRPKTVLDSPKEALSKTDSEKKGKDASLIKNQGVRPSLGKLDIDAPVFPDSLELQDHPPADRASAELRAKAKLIEHEMEDEELNVFKNIQKVKISVILDNSVSESKKLIVKKILNSTVVSLGVDPPELTIDKGELITAPPVDPLKWIFDLRQPLGMILVTLIFSTVIIFIFNGYRKIESRRIAVLEAQSQREEAEVQSKLQQQEVQNERAVNQAAAGGSGASTGVTPGEADTAPNLEGFDKFKALLAESPEKASSLVKQWLKAPIKGAALALAVLPQMLSTEEFLVIFNYLSLEDRKVWRKLLGTPIDKATLNGAANFIFSQIVESLLSTKPPIDQDLRELLSNLSINECIEVATESPTLGGLLVNLLPSMEVGRIFSLMNPELANAVTLESLKFSEEEIQNRAEELKERLLRLKQNRKAVGAPFVESATEVFRHIGPDKETLIFQALIESQEFELLESTAYKFFPAELVFKLPSRILKICMDRLTPAKRADLILSQDETAQKALLEAAGKEGSKLREVIDLEVEEARADEFRMHRIEKNKSSILKEFLEIVRSAIRSNKTVTEEADSVLDQWILDKTGRPPGGRNAATAEF